MRFTSRGLGRSAGALALMLSAGSIVHADDIALVGPPADAASLVEALDLAEESAVYTQAAVRRLNQSILCWPEGAKIPDQQFFLPPTMPRPIDTERYWVDGTVWTGDLSQGPSGRAQRANFTYSFPNDGTTWGLSTISTTGANTLNASLTTAFGAGNLDLGREYIRQALASWRRYCGLTYTEVADNNVPMDQVIARQSNRGDLRIGGRAFGTGSFLAYNAFPDPTFAEVGGSDMCINTSFFTATEFGAPSNNFRYFRNVIAHEHGHGLGAIHSVPCTGTKLMEPFIATSTDVVQIDDRRGGQRNYGDRFAGNNSPANAKNFGDLTSPILMSIIERNLSTNGNNGFNNSDEDWFRFTLSSQQNVVITAAPTGGTYTAGQQSFNCSGSTASINASSAGDLNVSLYQSDGITLQQPAVNAFGPGTTETLTSNNLPAGTYYVRIKDGIGSNSAANQIVQLYDLTMRVGAAKAPPEVIAGINKRVQANTNCYYFGNINSAVTESAGAIVVFEWDLDGDGTFEIANNAFPNRQYPSNGVYNITLRCTDNNGMKKSDTITTTVFGATTTVTNCAPSAGLRGAVIPITITGTNLKNVTASHVSISGTGVTITGTAVPNALGTAVDGLSLVIAANAPTTARNITVNNSDGNATGNALFTVQAPPPMPPSPFALAEPMHGATDVSLTPGFEWAASSGAVTYTLLIDDSAALTTPLFTQTGLTATSFNLPSGILSPSTSYWWGVVAINADGNTNSSPMSWIFTTQAPPPVLPGPFGLVDPPHGATDISLTPTFQWSASSDADTYTLKIDTDSALATPIFTQSGLTGTTFNLPGGVLADSTQYWWGVTAINTDGETDSTPLATTFTTATPPPPDCPGDANGDNSVDSADLSVLLGNFGQSVTPGTSGDLNDDGSVDSADLSVLLGAFGSTCP